MTISSNTLLVSLVLALCSNAVLLLLVLLQMQSGGNSAPDNIGKGCAISISLDGHNSGYSADLPQSSNERGAFKSDPGENLVFRPTGRRTHNQPVRRKQLDSSIEAQYERSETLQTRRSNRIANGDQSQQQLPRRPRSTDKKMESALRERGESLPLLNTGETLRQFQSDSVNSEFLNEFQNPDGENLSPLPSLFRQLLQDHLLKDSPESRSLDKRLLHTIPSSSSGKHSVSNVENTLGGKASIDSKRRTINTNSNLFQKIKERKDSHKPKIGSFDVDFKNTRNSTSAKQLLQRKKRKAVSKYKEYEEYEFDGSATSLLMMEEIFSAIKKRARKKFTDPVAKILLPALIHFETMIIRHLDRLNTVMISQDFRLESLETTLLERQHAPAFGPQSDAQDNKTGDQTDDIIAEGFIPIGNASITLEGDEGSGDIDVNIQTQTTPASTPMPFDNQRYLEIYHGLQTIKTKVNSLENFNTMVDSELTKTRTEVIKMDDKVTEISRRQKNLGTRTQMQMYRVTELESFMANTEISLHTTLDDFSRMSGRLDVFKDRLKQQSNEMYAMLAQYGRHDQLMEELRSADSYKAHDLNELRNSLMSLEDRINGLYRVLDQSVDTVRNDVRTMVDGLCTANRLMC